MQFKTSFRQLTSQDAAVLASRHEGWLWKQGGSIKTWKRRWFLLRGRALLYFRDDKTPHALGVIDLQNCLGVAEVKIAQYPNAFEIPVGGRTYLLAADTEEVAQKWLTAIRGALGGDGCADIVPPDMMKQLEAAGALVQQKSDPKLAELLAAARHDSARDASNRSQSRAAAIGPTGVVSADSSGTSDTPPLKQLRQPAPSDAMHASPYAPAGAPADSADPARVRVNTEPRTRPAGAPQPARNTMAMPPPAAAMAAPSDPTGDMYRVIVRAKPVPASTEPAGCAAPRGMARAQTGASGRRPPPPPPIDAGAPGASAPTTPADLPIARAPPGAVGEAPSPTLPPSPVPPGQQPAQRPDAAACDVPAERRCVYGAAVSRSRRRARRALTSSRGRRARQSARDDAGRCRSGSAADGGQRARCAAGSDGLPVRLAELMCVGICADTRRAHGRVAATHGPAEGRWLRDDQGRARPWACRRR